MGHDRKLLRKVTSAKHTKDCQTIEEKSEVDSDSKCAAAAPALVHKTFMKHRKTKKAEFSQAECEGHIGQVNGRPRNCVGVGGPQERGKGEAGGFKVEAYLQCHTRAS